MNCRIALVKWAAIAVACVPACSQPAGAATNTWDAAGGNSIIEEGGGTWAVGSTNWFDGAIYDQVWADGNDAVFGGGATGTAGTVTITGTVNASSVTLNNPFAGNYTLGGAGILDSTGLLTKNGSATATLGGSAAINIGGAQISGGRLVVETTVASADNKTFRHNWGTDLEIKGNGSLTAGGRPQFLFGNITLRDNGKLGLYGFGNFELQDGYGVPMPTTLTVLDNATFEVDRNGVAHGYIGTGGVNTQGAGGFCYGQQWNQYSTATIDQQGGTVNLTNPMDGVNPWGPGLVLALDGAAGTNICHKYNLSGGVLNVSGVINIAPFAPTGPTNSGGNGWAPVFNFNGGTMRASQSDSTAASDIAKGWDNLMANLWHAYVQAGGAIIDTQNFTCSIDQALEHDPALGGDPDGGLRKLGSGTLTLSRTNTYTGATTVSNGTLNLSAPGSLGGTEVTVGANTNQPVLKISGNYTIGTATAGSLTVSGGTDGSQGTLSLVDGTINTLTLTNNASADVFTIGGTNASQNSILNMEAGDISDLIVVGGGTNAKAKLLASGEKTVVNITCLGNFSGERKTLIFAPGGVDTAGGVSFADAFVLGAVSGNLNDYAVGLESDETHLYLGVDTHPGTVLIVR